MGRRASTSHEDRTKIRALYAVGRDAHKLTLKEIGEKFELSISTILRIVQYDDVDMAKLREREERADRAMARDEDRSGTRGQRLADGIKRGLEKIEV
jgi:hypothetical protein